MKTTGSLPNGTDVRGNLTHAHSLAEAWNVKPLQEPGTSLDPNVVREANLLGAVILF